MRKFTVGGMSCAACSARVEKAVGSLQGVESCSVNLLTGTMAVEGELSDGEIIAAVEKAGYTAASGGEKNAKSAEVSEKSGNSEVRALIKRLCVSAALLLILMYFSMGHMLSLPLPKVLSETPTVVALVQFLLSASVLVINQKFFISGTRAAFLRAPNMDTLVALGSAAAFGYSIYILFVMLLHPVSAHSHLHELYFESAAMILVLITVGKLLESIAKGRTTNAIKSLMKLSPRTATVLRDGEEKVIPTEELIIGDIFLVRPGDSIPVDGEILEGEGAVDESMLTGESIPADKYAGARVFAGTSNRSGFLKCRATSVGEETAIANIIKMVSNAAATKAPIARLADKVSGVFVPFVLAVAALVTVIWAALGYGTGFAIERGISVLVISCPCALGLATPVAIMVGSGVGARRGILFKNATAIESAGKVKNIVLDKTGTITEGHPRVTKTAAFGIKAEELLALAAALEEGSEHPLARAICEYAEEKKIEARESKSFKSFAGGGVSALVDGTEVLGGSLKFIGERVKIHDEGLQIYKQLASEGNTPTLFAKDGELIGIIAIRDAIKSDSRAAIREMCRMGINVTMLTGDNELSARAIASEVGVDNVISGVLPEGKERVVQKLQEKGTVMMVGDGVNDAPALTRADVGVAIGRGTDVAIDSADVVLTGSGLSDAVRAVKLGRRVLLNIKENLFWAFCYNIIGIPLAAGVFIASFGWELNPMFGAAAMSLSSFFVVMNALRLNLVNLDFDGVEKLTVSSLAAVTLESDAGEEKETQNEERNEERVFVVRGMMCSHCEGRVEEVVKSIEGVREAEARHGENKLTVLCTPDTDGKKIMAAVEAAGYEISP